MEILIVLLLVVLNGLFALSELAVVSSRRTRLQEMQARGVAGADTALMLLDDPNRFLSTVQIGITLIGILSGAFGESALGEDVAGLLSKTPIPDQHTRSVAFALIVGLTTYLSLVIGELIPKRVALGNPERIASLVSRPMLWLSRLAAPLVFLLTVSTEGLLRLLGLNETEESPVTESEILALIRHGALSGAFQDGEDEMVAGVFRLDTLRAEQLMTPRTEINWLDVEDSIAENQVELLSSPHAYYPVCQGSLDQVLGVLRSRDWLTARLNGESPDLRDLVIQPVFVPESVSGAEILKRFRVAGMAVALVISEYGGIEGMITYSDLMNEIVGEIEPEEALAVQRADGSWLLDGALPIDEVNDHLPTFAVPADEAGDYQTLAGFVLTRLKHVPKVGEIFEWGEVRFEVVDMDGPRIDKLLVQTVEPPTTDSATEE